MRWTQTFIPTMKETPEGAEIPSHVLMLRAGLIHQVMAGAYTYLPLGLRSLRKAEAIVREEMDAAGAVELAMSCMSPISLWEQTGRVEAFGDVLVTLALRRKDRKVPVALGPTHEEIITDLVARHISSYRQMPITLYQITTKFRNEERPRFGVLAERADESYQKMFEAYNRIFTRCGLKFRPVEADTGSIGGSYSHEFLVIADSGEDAMAYCEECGYAANMEKAEIARPEAKETQAPLLPLQEAYTPEVRTIEEVCSFLGVVPEQVVKTLVFSADEVPVAVMVRGNEEVNEIKVKNFLGCEVLEMAMDDMIQAAAGSPRGFVGPIGIKCRVLADYSLIGLRNMVVGANKENYHLKNVNFERDFQVAEFADLRVIRESDPCPRCRREIRFARGIEVGHVFKLGTKYSKAMKAVYLDGRGQEQYMVMGCYGIGVGRTVAACIEQSHDGNGIIWPLAVAPYHVIITPVNMKEKALATAAEELYAELSEEGVEVLLDDRDERAGVKFKDADLIGIPMRVTIGPKNLALGKVELKLRSTGETNVLSGTEAKAAIVSAVYSL